jgi:vesicle-fusing ATPase
MDYNGYFTIYKHIDTTTAFKNSVFLNPKFVGVNYIQIYDYKANMVGEKPKEYQGIIYRVRYLNDVSENQIVFNSAARDFLGFTIGSQVKIKPYLPVYLQNAVVSNASIIIEPVTKSKQDIQIDEDELEMIKTNLLQVPLSTLHKYFYSSQISGIQLQMFLIGQTKNQVLQNIMIGENTDIEFTSLSPNIKIKTSQASNMFKGNFNFQAMGIGGLDKQFEIIFRRAFASRVIPDKVAKDLGINHVRGILLYGPPGCGKTLVARKMGQVLNCAEPKIVNGPSLLSKYVGESEENVRKLFADAIADKSGSQLHLIICDEFDALVKKRGSSGDNTGTGDKIVNQFLTMIDGPESLNNILLICMTNRRDLIDEAILRPGRLEVQIEISLPDESGRKEILQIHTMKMKSTGHMESTINLDEIAANTKNFTGAEIESVVKTSVSYALSRELDPTNLAQAKNINPIVTKSDFERSLREIKPQFGTRSTLIDIICSTELEFYSDEYKETYADISNKMQALKSGNRLSLLLSGPNYIGKTKMVAHLAKDSDYNCVKFINAESLSNSYAKDIYLNDLVESGLKSQSCIFILDSIEKIIEYSKLGNIYNNKILQSIYILLDKIIDPANKIIVLITSSNPNLCETLDITNLVDYSYQLTDTEGIAYKFKSNKLAN